ncbi:MAG: hydantoinase B/oxoprolinase family protein, partial [Sporichthyaceae bacterium]
YEKHIRMRKDAHFMSIADRSILACWGVKGGKAGKSFQVTIDPGGPAEREVDALADAEPVRSGETIRIRTTGGGGWGDPMDRDVAAVVRDVEWGKVSVDGARTDYGVVLSAVGGVVTMDDPATDTLRTEQRSRRTGDEPFFDRGPGYARLSGGKAYAEVDVL